MAKKVETRFDECDSFLEGKTLYRKELLKCHPDQGGTDTDLIKLRKEFDVWVSTKAWEARQSGGSFRSTGGFGGLGGGTGGQFRSTDPEDFLSDRTKQILREVVESGLNCTIEIVGSFIWIDEVSPQDVLTMIAWDFQYSKKYGGKWYWADWDYLKKTGNMPKGRFKGSFEDMKTLHRNKGVREKQFLAMPEEEP